MKNLSERPMPDAPTHSPESAPPTDAERDDVALLMDAVATCWSDFVEPTTRYAAQVQITELSQRIRERLAENERLRADRAALTEDAARWKYCLENAGWYRSDDAGRNDYMKIPVAKGADLSCIAFRREAVDAARASHPEPINGR